MTAAAVAALHSPPTAAAAAAPPSRMLRVGAAGPAPRSSSFSFPREAFGWASRLQRRRGRRRAAAAAAQPKKKMARPPILSVALPSDTGRVLSIQSHTVQGYVGNKSAVFPLQLLGFDVDPINSVQFSNHTGYPTFRGQVLNGKQLWDLIEGLEENELLHYTHLLTVCDPVLGDEGKLYVPQELISLYQQKVVITSALIEGKLLLIGSHKKTKEQPPEQFKIEIPKIPAYFTGTGDLTTALLLGWSNKYPDNLETAAELAVSSLQALLKRTVEDYKKAGFDPSTSSLEIRLIQSQDNIRNPVVTCKAVKYSN
nr:unnamed protein product [Digitaria exilis]